MVSPRWSGTHSPVPLPAPSIQQINIMLLNIVIAVLLDAFMGASAEENNKMKKELQAEENSHSSGPLDPLLDKWLEGFAGNEDLDDRIVALW